MILRVLRLTFLPLAGACFAQPISAAPGAFGYTMRMTPEEGPIDPAIQRRYTPQWKACQQHASTTAANASCFGTEFDRQNALLNKAWDKALRRVPAPRHQSLLMAQRRWIAERDPFCKNYASDLRGSLTQLALLDCRVEQTIRRTIWLESL